MKNTKIVRALKDKNYRAQLSTVEQKQLGSRIGIAEIDVSLLDAVAGGGNSYSHQRTCAPTNCCACLE